MLNKNKSLSTRIVFYVLSSCILLFVISLSSFYFFSKQQLEEMTYRNAEILTGNTALNIEQTLLPITRIAGNYSWMVENQLADPGSLEGLTRKIVQNNPEIMGCAISLAPSYYSNRGKYFAPYSFRKKDSIVSKQLGSRHYDYFSMDWYRNAVTTKKPCWSDPYFDAGGANTLMVTYAVPLFSGSDTSKQIVGVLSMDLALDKFTSIVNAVKILETGYATVISADGTFVTNPNKTLILNQTIFSYAEKVKQPALMELGREMLLKKTGIISTSLNGEEVKVYHKSLKSSNWILVVIFPKSEMYAPLQKIFSMLVALVVLGLLLLVFIIIKVVSKQIAPLSLFAQNAKEIAKGNFQTPLPEIHTKDELMGLRNAFVFMQQNLVHYISNLKSATSAKEKIESEIRIAREIQMGMIPQIFPAFPDNPQIDLHAFLSPAKLVGGDLYDYFIEQNRLYFIIADVSGKGIPASLLMAVTRSLFRSVSLQWNNPAQIVAILNKSIAENNESNLFVTLFIGMLDLKSGLMEYCNAGHNPPVLVNNNSVFLPVLPNLAIGLVPDFEFERQEFQFDIGTTLLLYTDGLTEAENKDKKLYGNDQLLQLLSQNQYGSAREMIGGIANDVHGHVLDAEQSDDLAMVALVYKGTSTTSCYAQKIILLNEVSQIPVLQSFVQNLGEDLQLNASRIMNLNLALEEAVSNIIFYAYPNETGKTIQLSVLQHDNALFFTVTDQGLPFDPTQSKDPPLNLTAEQRPLGGLGIYLIKQIMDEVGYSRNGENNVLTMKMNLINNHQ